MTSGADYVAFGGFFASGQTRGERVEPALLTAAKTRWNNVAVVAIGGITRQGRCSHQAGADAQSHHRR